ncbi:5-epiaristolochene synthase [Handroanthus impetiginosus]|uniref:5-epiaristolochene synthase n=1 Tax=Handroanthus impetiginosus TaxID=429701 RepID=A0A2G9GK55_9LAMI|nr:5-epiaristolochene synthase [Handroanthus impetiginosus]
MKELARGYNTEAKCSYNVITTASYLGMNSAPKEAFDWAMKQHRLQVATAILGRIMNDTASHKFEKKRGQPTTGIECYMNEYGVSEEEALKEFYNIAENAWKDINEEFVKKNDISMEIIITAVNLSRVTYVVYKHNQD